MSDAGSAPTGQEAVQQPTDMRSHIVAALEKVESQEKPVDQPVDQPVDKPAPAAEDKPAGPARDASGRFAAKEPAKDAQVEKPVDQPVEPPPTWATAPKSWKKEMTEGWAALSPAYQQYVHEREQQMKASYDAAAPRAQLGEAIQKVAEPYMNTITGLGLDLPRAVQGLMDVDHRLRTLPYPQKLQLLVETAQAYGIDLTGQAQQLQQQPQQGFNPFAQTQHEILQMRGELQTFKQQQEAQLQEAALEQIEQFSKTAEHFEEAKPMMAKLLQSGFATTLPEAYQQAIRLSPQLYEKVQTAQQAQAAADKSRAADEAAKRAKAAAVSPKSATPGAPKPANAQDRRSVIREALEQSLSQRL